MNPECYALEGGLREKESEALETCLTRLITIWLGLQTRWLLTGDLRPRVPQRVIKASGCE